MLQPFLYFSSFAVPNVRLVLFPHISDLAILAAHSTFQSVHSGGNSPDPEGDIRSDRSSRVVKNCLCALSFCSFSCVSVSISPRRAVSCPAESAIDCSNLCNLRLLCRNILCCLGDALLVLLLFHQQPSGLLPTDG